MKDERMHARIGGEDLERGARRRVALKNDRYIFTQMLKHFCKNPLFRIEFYLS